MAVVKILEQKDGAATKAQKLFNSENQAWKHKW